MNMQNNHQHPNEGLQPSRTREAHQKAARKDCRHLDSLELEAWADRVGWCCLAGQYRSAALERECDSFSHNGEEK